MRILVGDNQPSVRFALRVLLEQQPGLEVVGEATDAHDLAAKVRSACPDLLLVGWELPGLAPTSMVSDLRGSRPGLAVIVLSARSESSRAALSAGADRFVNKGDPPEKLLAAIAACKADARTMQ
ncbi:MAG: response regulator transcription factor [Anaerolineae bacterium]